tara:strand:+ start:2788 stop:3894 length:1107 start_codon:yes stop_codon:yes gene_type:complete
MDFIEFKESYLVLSNRYQEIIKYIDIDKFNKELDNLKKLTFKENFWQNKDKATSILKDISKIKYDLDYYKSIDDHYENLKVSFELAELSELVDEETIGIIDTFKNLIDDLEIKKTLNGKDDFRDAIIQIHPGAGGVESQDWASMLFRMYSKWIKSNKFSSKLIDFQSGDESGIKDAIIEVKGEYAYGLLKSEMGVHRLVRISPFDSNSRRHTSFASVFVYPIIDNDIEITINDNDIRIDTYRASGAGGQHVNKTDSAVRITHLETGITVQCQNQRSQLKNKNIALQLLKSKLYKMKIDEIDKTADEKNNKKDISWGSQIRSYIFHPYNLVKDHRTKIETSNTNAVMDGNINNFIKSYLLRNIGDNDGK